MVMGAPSACWASSTKGAGASAVWSVDSYGNCDCCCWPQVDYVQLRKVSAVRGLVNQQVGPGRKLCACHLMVHSIQSS